MIVITLLKGGEQIFNDPARVHWELWNARIKIPVPIPSHSQEKYLP
jgi:hypothetical protein